MKQFFLFALFIIPNWLFCQSALQIAPNQSFASNSIQLFSLSLKNVEETDRDIIISPAVEVWRSRWSSFSYVADNTNIDPAWIFCPSVNIKIQNFSFNIDFNKSFGSENIPSLGSVVRAATEDYLGSGIEIIYGKKEPYFTTELWYANYKGMGVWDVYEDTITFKRVINEFPVDSKIFYVDFFPDERLVGGGLARVFGIRFTHYNAPASIIGITIPDPRNPSNKLVWEEVADTRFNHFFLILNSGRLLERWLEAIEQKNKKVNFNFDIHWYTLFLGFGWGHNQPMGRFFSYSTPYASSQIGGLVLNMEFDLGIKLTVPLKNSRDFGFKFGARWTDWELISSEKKDLIARSKDRFYGLYFKAFGTL